MNYGHSVTFCNDAQMILSEKEDGESFRVRFRWIVDLTLLTQQEKKNMAAFHRVPPDPTAQDSHTLCRVDTSRVRVLLPQNGSCECCWDVGIPMT